MVRLIPGHVAQWNGVVDLAEAQPRIADATLDGTRKVFLANLATVPLLIIDDLGMRKLPHTAAEDLLEQAHPCQPAAPASTISSGRTAWSVAGKRAWARSQNGTSFFHRSGSTPPRPTGEGEGRWTVEPG
jgi:hypothetical protein